MAYLRKKCILLIQLYLNFNSLYAEIPNSFD